MGYLEMVQQKEADKQKARAYDQLIAQQQQKELAKQAYKQGANDGLAAVVSSISHAQMSTPQAEQLGYYSPEADISDAEMQEAAKLFGPHFDARDIQELRRYKQLQHILPSHEEGLASKSIKGH